MGPIPRSSSFTIQNGDDGILAFGKLEILSNRFLNNKDAVDYQDSGGINSGNLYENNGDDGIDVDGASEVTIENQILFVITRTMASRSAFTNTAVPPSTSFIRNNTISGNKRDGIQLIDYPDVSDRIFLIERNLIQGNRRVGLGMMDNGETLEDFRGASIPEPIRIETYI